MDAVIDKDLVSARLAEEVGVDVFLIATDVPGVALNFGQADEEFLPSVTISKANKYMKTGQFPGGSMGPKIQAAIQFLQSGGKRALIASVEEIEAAVSGKTGTEIKN